MTALILSEKKKYSLPEIGMKTCGMLPETATRVCNLHYLLIVSRGNKKIFDSIVDVFFIETKKELVDLDSAIKKRNHSAISHIAHKIKSAFLILGITALEPVFKEMEQLIFNPSSMSNIEWLNQRVNLVFNQAKKEMKLKD